MLFSRPLETMLNLREWCYSPCLGRCQYPPPYDTTCESLRAEWTSASTGGEVKGLYTCCWNVLHMSIQCPTLIPLYIGVIANPGFHVKEPWGIGAAPPSLYTSLWRAQVPPQQVPLWEKFSGFRCPLRSAPMWNGHVQHSLKNKNLLDRHATVFNCCLGMPALAISFWYF